jgi:hypothetical protein
LREVNDSLSVSKCPRCPLLIPRARSPRVPTSLPSPLLPASQTYIERKQTQSHRKKTNYKASAEESGIVLCAQALKTITHFIRLYIWP